MENCAKIVFHQWTWHWFGFLTSYLAHVIEFYVNLIKITNPQESTLSQAYHLVVVLRRISFLDYTHTFTVDTIHWNTLGWRLQRYLCAYRLFRGHNKYQQWGAATTDLAVVRRGGGGYNGGEGQRLPYPARRQWGGTVAVDLALAPATGAGGPSRR